MSVVIDPPRSCRLHGRRVFAALLLSDRPGKDGQRELVKFGRRLGLTYSALERPGLPDEHFTVIGDETYDQAVAKGARPIHGPALVSIIRAKKGVAS